MPQNMSLGSNGVDRMRSLRKIPTHQFGPFCTKVRAVTKHEFGVQWGELGAFVAKNSNATLLDEFLH
jgi:hypothetical protein